MKKICVVGHFGVGKNLLNGQTIKTKTITKELQRQLKKEQVGTIDTHGGYKHFPRIFFQFVLAFIKHNNIVIAPAHNGVKVFAPLCVLLNSIFHRRIHYVVIGGWIVEMIKKRPILKNCIKRFDCVYVETSNMHKELLSIGLSNSYIMPNFKDLSILKTDELIYNKKEPLKLCVFSRIMKKKGIEDAIWAVKTINEKYRRIIYKLDIYGQVDLDEYDWFDSLKIRLPSYINYKGIVEYKKSVDTLKHYYAILFPTLFYTEGIPGTILDAYAAGVPIISSKWESFNDVIKEGKTGMGYSFGEKEELVELLDRGIDIDTFNSLKTDCLKEAYEYRPSVVINVLIKNLV